MATASENTVESKPWERQSNEPPLWFNRFTEYLHQGTARSLIAVYRVSVKKRRVKARQGAENVPGAWRTAIKKWQWRERADAFDAHERSRKDELYKAKADEILQSGFALRFARVHELNRLAELLQHELYTEDKRWVPDVKQIGGGEYAERVDIVHFNSAVIEQYRNTLEDIAVEMGERVRGLKVSGTLGVASITGDELAKARSDTAAFEQERFGAESDGE
jgi:hypothetical protein